MYYGYPKNAVRTPKVVVESPDSSFEIPDHTPNPDARPTRTRNLTDGVLKTFLGGKLIKTETGRTPTKRITATHSDHNYSRTPAKETATPSSSRTTPYSRPTPKKESAPTK